MRRLAGNFMMVWSFFISKVTRELTLLSATSFGKRSHAHSLNVSINFLIIHTLHYYTVVCTIRGFYLFIATKKFPFMGLIL